MHGWQLRVGLTWLAATMAVGCIETGPPSAAASGVGSDESCRRPPWFPSPAPRGVRAVTCKDDRSVRFVLGSGAPATDADAERFLEAHRDALHAIEGLDGSGFGTCCSEDAVKPNEQCISLDLRMCSTPLPELIEQIQVMQAGDGSLTRRALRVSVRLNGLTGPRCKADEANCGPIPYARHTLPVPEVRMPFRMSPSSGESCTHDGECIADGCGNECVHWTEAGGAGTCPFVTALENSFCGCAQSRCDWFR